MAWDGYFTYAGQEFINADRTQVYATHAVTTWFKGCHDADALGAILGEVYRNPLQDPAPWSDPDNLNSYEFYGAYPLGVTGIEDSTRVGEVVESTQDGGTVNRLRHGTRAVVFNVVLIGATDAAVEYGARWLRRLLLGAACGPSSTSACFGADLCYLSSEPALDWQSDGDPTDCLSPLIRTLHQVVVNTGPTVTSKQTTVDGGAIWTVTFTATAGNPYEYGVEVPIVEQFGKLSDPYVSTPKGSTNMNGPIVDDTACLSPLYMPVYDPTCPAVVPPPTPPSVPIGCYKAPVNWKRRQFTIPKEHIPLWMDVVPTIKVHAQALTATTNLRFRFYADVDGDNDILDDPCSYCGDIVVSYVPPGQALVIDGAEQQVYVEAPGGIRRRADAVVFSTDGGPFEWPVLSCGFGYIVTVDCEQTAKAPSVDLSLTARAA
jgi:hypothetical protein